MKNDYKAEWRNITSKNGELLHGKGKADYMKEGRMIT